MIHVEVTYHNDCIIAFSMSGHADAGPYGYDLVCAGASAVSFGAVNAIAELCRLELPVIMEDNGGLMKSQIPSVDTATDMSVQLLLKGMIVSLETIAEQYSEYINIEYIPSGGE